MFTRALSNEKHLLEKIVAERFPGASDIVFGRIERGISNVKYWLNVSSRKYVVKLYSGNEYRRRATLEHTMLSKLYVDSEVPVPEPIAYVEVESPSPIACVIMSMAEGSPLDEVIPYLNDGVTEHLGAALGILLEKLHSISEFVYAELFLDSEYRFDVTTARPSDFDLATEAEALGVLTQDDMRAFRFLRARNGEAAAGPILVHGDFGLENILVEISPRLRVTAILDFERCRIGEPGLDFSKVSVGGGEREEQLLNAMLTSYCHATGMAESATRRMRDQVAAAQVLSDLRVAMDLARDPFRDVYLLAATEHQAWRQVARLYRTLRLETRMHENPARRFSTEQAILKAEHIAQQSRCKVRQVGAIILDEHGLEVSRGVNGLTGVTTDCWCATAASTVENRPNCPAVHAERLAIAAADQQGLPLRGLTLVSNTCPCLECARWIVRSGLSTVFYSHNYRDTRGVDYLLGSNVSVVKVDHTQSDTVAEESNSSAS